MNSIATTAGIPAQANVSVATKSPSIVRHVTTTGRILLGLPLAIFGLNAFLNFIPPPTTPLPQGAMDFVGALANSGYMFQLIGATQLIVGVLLLLNRFVPLALVLFTPFIVNSIAFHIALEPSGLGMAAIFLALTLFLAWRYRAAYRSLLTAR